MAREIFGPDYLPLLNQYLSARIKKECNGVIVPHSTVDDTYTFSASERWEIFSTKSSTSFLASLARDSE